MFIVTAFLWEDRGGTRITVGCEQMARRTFDAIQTLGYTARLTISPEPPARSQEEIDRADRLAHRIAPIIFGEAS
jgi:hypothetical protein